MVKVSRVLDSVQIGAESTVGTEASSYDQTSLFGHITNCSLKVDHDVAELKGIQGGTTTGHKVSRLVDLKATPSGTISFQPDTLKWMKYVMSDYAEGAGQYTLDDDSTALPSSLSIKGSYTSAKSVRALGSYLTNVKFSLTEGDIFTVTCDIVNLVTEDFTGTVSYTVPDVTPLIFSDGVFTFGGNEWDLKSLNISFNPKFAQRWGINTKTNNEKQFPTSILRAGKLDIKYDGVCNNDSPTNELEAAWGSTKAADQRSNSSCVLTFTDEAADTHVITLTGRTTSEEITQSGSEEDYKTMSFNATGIDMSIVGDILA